MVHSLQKIERIWIDWAISVILGSSGGDFARELLTMTLPLLTGHEVLKLGHTLAVYHHHLLNLFLASIESFHIQDDPQGFLDPHFSPISLWVLSHCPSPRDSMTSCFSSVSAFTYEDDDIGPCNGVLSACVYYSFIPIHLLTDVLTTAMFSPYYFVRLDGKRALVSTKVAPSLSVSDMSRALNIQQRDAFFYDDGEEAYLTRELISGMNVSNGQEAQLTVNEFPE